MDNTLLDRGGYVGICIVELLNALIKAIKGRGENAKMGIEGEGAGNGRCPKWQEVRTWWRAPFSLPARPGQARPRERSL